MPRPGELGQHVFPELPAAGVVAVLVSRAVAEGLPAVQPGGERGQSEPRAHPLTLPGR